jgi:Arm DNA-binding domain
VREPNRLTALKVSKTRKPGRYGDGGGLYLQVSPAHTKSWLFKFMRHGRAREMGLGPVAIVPLADARDKARAARRLLLEGLDPIETRREARLKARADTAKTMTFRQCAEAYIKAHRAGWNNAKHIWQWESSLSSLVFPIFGALAVDAIDTGLVIKVLEPIWTTKTETATRVRQRIEAVLDWARARGYRRARTRPGGGVTSTSCWLRRTRSRRSDISPRCPMPTFPRSSASSPSASRSPPRRWHSRS